MINGSKKRTVGTSARWPIQSDRRGATTVEFAVVFPILLLFIFGLFELYSVFRVHSEAVTSLARGGREASIVTASNADIEAAVRNNLTLFGISEPQIAVEPPDIGPGTREINITVRIAPGAANGLFFYRYFSDDIVKSVTFHRL